jgi:hypothetical protein
MNTDLTREQALKAVEEVFDTERHAEKIKKLLIQVASGQLSPGQFTAACLNVIDRAHEAHQERINEIVDPMNDHYWETSHGNPS